MSTTQFSFPSSDSGGARGGAIVVFVKTPGLSPVKTRLAAQIGRDRADQFYELSLAAVEKTVHDAAASTNVAAHWAIAEEAGLDDPRWQRMPRVWQGDGELGDRLAHVFEQLQQRFAAVVAIGGDSPQLTPEPITRSFESLPLPPGEGFGSGAHVLGRSHDGGFYLVGTSAKLPCDVWHDIPYSTDAAADRMAANLKPHGMITELAQLTDVDEAADLAVLAKELSALATPSPEQLALLEWIER